jgi:hypothetical protein
MENIMSVDTEFGPEDFGQCPYREKEILAGGPPAAGATVEGASGNDIVDVRMVLQLAAPGMEDGEKAGCGAADIFFVPGEFFDCRR